MSPILICTLATFAPSTRNSSLAQSLNNRCRSRLRRGRTDKSNATFGGTIQSVPDFQIPLNGRNITNLELLAPGAIDFGSGAQISIVSPAMEPTTTIFDSMASTRARLSCFPPVCITPSILNRSGS